MSGPAHRSVSNIRPTIAGLPGTRGGPQTPTRALSSSYASPSAIRAEEECVIIELGSRRLKAGLSGDALPKAVIAFDSNDQRRYGDFRHYQNDYDTDWRERANVSTWGGDHALWELDLRHVDLGLVGDKIERAVREAFTKYLLIDSRPRKMALALPTDLPTPLLSTILDTLFNVFQSSTISLMSAPMLITAAAGLRAALVVDLGWAETTVTGVYEYREVVCRRSVRGARCLSLEVLKMLVAIIDPNLATLPGITLPTEEQAAELEGASRRVISFKEVEDIMERMIWCKGVETFDDARSTEGLAAVQEEEELEGKMQSVGLQSKVEDKVLIPLTSTKTPTTIHVPFAKLAEPCETALFADCDEGAKWDDEELPLHHLLYLSLLQLPLDIRSICMSRIIFTGGISNTPGLKDRIMNELQDLIDRRGWNRVEGRAILQLRKNQDLPHSRSKQASSSPVQVIRQDTTKTGNGHNNGGRAADEKQVADPIEERLQSNAKKRSAIPMQGVLRAVDSMGAWSGASLLSLLRTTAVTVIEREQWLQHRAPGASRSGEAVTLGNRQSMVPGGLKSGAGDRTSWSLGALA